MGKKISIIGTSNSIMDNGWADQVKRKENGLLLNNLSLGGCPSIYAAFALIYNDIADSDIVVFDFCVNDMMALDAGMLSVGQILGYYSAAIRELSDLHLIDKALFLLFPLRKHCGKPNQRMLLEPIIELLNKYKIRYIDYDVEIMGWAKDRGRSELEVFKDWAHFTPEFSSVIAERVISHTKSRADNITRSSVGMPPPEIKLSVLARTSTCSGLSIKGTSLRKFPVCTYAAGQELVLSGDSYLIGLLHWHHAQSLALTMYHSLGASRSVIRRDWHNMFRCESFRHAIPLDAKLKIVVENNHDIPADKHFGLSETDFVETSGTVDIVEMIGCSVDPEIFGNQILSEQ